MLSAHFCAPTQVWKARVSAYEELAKKFRIADPADWRELTQYEGYLKKMAVDANAVAQESALFTIINYIDNAPNAEKTRETLIPVIVEKCFGSTRAGTKSKSVEVILLYIEIDVADPVVELVLPGLDAKQPKLVAQTVFTLKEISTGLSLEIYRWLGTAMSIYLSELKPVQVKELEEGFAKLPAEKPIATRLLRSMAAAAEVEQEAAVTEEESVDAFDLAEPVDILAKMDKEFFTQITATKWQVRKEALDNLLAVLKTPRIADGNYQDLVGALAKRMTDANIVCMTTAANCIEALALGMRNAFGKYKPVVTGPMIEKLKERKQTVVEALMGALAATFESVSIADIMEDVTAGTAHKNPQVRAETVKLITRRLKTIREPPNRTEIKTLTEMMLKTYEDGDAAVREASAEGLGTLMKCVGEKAMLQYLEKLDDIKTAKMKEFFEKAEVKAKPATAAKKPPPPAAAPRTTKPKSVKPPPSEDSLNESPPTEPAAPKRKAPTKPPASAAPAAAAAPKKSAPPPSSKKKPSPDEPLRYKFTPEDAEERAPEHIPADILTQLADSAWKTRLAGIEALYSKYEDSDINDIEAEIVVRMLGKKPGWKDSNFQVLAKVFAVCQLLASECPTFSNSSAALAIPGDFSLCSPCKGCVEKLGDLKLKKAAGDCLTAFVEKTSLQFVFSQSYEPWKKQKAPKALADSLTWIHATLMEFGITGLQVRELIDFIKFCLASSNAAVRTNAVTVLGVLRLYIGPEVKSFVQDVNPTLLATIEAEFAKVADMEPPKPPKASATSATGDEALEDLFPRVDIGSQLNSKLLEECNDANWKVRKEGLEKVIGIIEAANKRIKPNLGDFVTTLKSRLADKNQNLRTMALEITGTLAVAMGKPFDKYVKVVTGPVVNVLTDSKADLRTAGIATLESIRKVCGLEPMVSAIATSLPTDSAVLRKDLLTWLAESLKDDIPTNLDLSPLVPPILTCLQDRSADVRKAGQSTLPGLITNVGYDHIMQKIGDLKPSSRQSVMPMLEAARSLAAPAKPILKQEDETKESQPKLKSKAVSNKRNPPTASNTKSTPVAPSQEASDRASDRAAPILSSDNRAKQARAKKDSSIGKWTFEVPRPDLLEHLSMQMENNFSSEVRALLFSTGNHADKDYLNAVTILDDCIASPELSHDKYGVDYTDMKARYVANADIVLKYLTLRFFDTGTTMMIKCLDLLEHLVAVLDEESYHLTEYEASAFLPFFINKVGDPKEGMRTRIRGIMKSLTRIYPASKMFNYILDAISASKNARTRSECLEELGALIQRNGISVMLPNKALPAIAANIGDRDANVRSAALGAISQAYMLVGDPVYKHVGPLSDKDKSMLDERLRRVKPPTPTAPPKPEQEEDDEPEIFDRVPPGMQKSRLQFQRFEPNKASEPVRRSQPVDEYENTKQDFSLELDKLDLPQPSNINPEVPFALTQPPALSAPTPQRVLGQSDRKDYMMDYIVTQITSGDAYQSIDALKQLDKYLNSVPDIVLPHVDSLVNAMTLQVRLAYTALDTRSPSLTRLCKHLVNAIVLLFASRELAMAVSQDSLHQLLQELAHRLLDQNMLALEPGPQLSKALNVAMVKVLENSNRNATVSALLLILEKCSSNLRNLEGPVASAQAKFTELIMKCLWKLAKTIQENLRAEALNPSQLLLAINNFFIATPPSEWKRRAIDKVPLGEMPLRTVKTLLLELVNGLGDDVFNKLDLIQDPQRSCVYPYLHHMLEACKKKDKTHSQSFGEEPRAQSRGIASRPSSTSSLHSNGSTFASEAISLRDYVNGVDRESSVGALSRNASIGDLSPSLAQRANGHDTVNNDTRVLSDTEMNNLLTQIFVKIGTREQTKQGIYELYEFQKKHPGVEVKVNAHLAQTGTYFQSYIRRGLSNLATEDVNGAKGNGNTSPTQSTTLLKEEKLESIPPIPTAFSSVPTLSAMAAKSEHTGEKTETYKQKLLRLQQRFGYKTDLIDSPDELNLEASFSGRRSSVTSEDGNPQRAGEFERAQTVSALKERLARMKSSAHGYGTSDS
ncbi:armadillo-type protein [Endogone sp. FLAS-F59071]|nr:armadillo-type protein [Endogone sp. FLAS-F59071]|eukprot:RUS19776.1 armadillo-type protein [Endogone sp. FLAS-F59071]